MADWKSDLSDFFSKQQHKAEADELKQKETRSDVKNYLATEVAPALEELKSELEKHGRQVSIETSSESATIVVSFGGHEEFGLTVKTSGSRVYPETSFREQTDGKMYRSEGSFRKGPDILNVKKDDIIAYFIEQYQKGVSR